MSATCPACSSLLNYWGARHCRKCGWKDKPVAALPPAESAEGKRHVVCAAIRSADGDVLLGIRHYSIDMRRQIEQRMDGAKFKHRHDEDQGFVDQHGVFMSRTEAAQVAMAEGRFIRVEACAVDIDGNLKLHSEGLY